MENIISQALDELRKVVAMEYHLQYNIYPPQPLELVPFCFEAIRYCNDGEGDMVLSDIKSNGKPVRANDLVNELGLHSFLENEE